MQIILGKISGMIHISMKNYFFYLLLVYKRKIESRPGVILELHSHISSARISSGEV